MLELHIYVILAYRRFQILYLHVVSLMAGFNCMDKVFMCYTGGGCLRIC